MVVKSRLSVLGFWSCNTKALGKDPDLYHFCIAMGVDTLYFQSRPRHVLVCRLGAASKTPKARVGIKRYPILFPPHYQCYASLSIHCSSFVYMMSVRKVYFVPAITSAPECSRSLCWNIRTRPALGCTSM